MLMWKWRPEDEWAVKYQIVIGAGGHTGTWSHLALL